MYKYQSKCKFRMLTTIGNKIVEIRPKQIIESNVKIDNDYLVCLNSKGEEKKKVTKQKKKQVKLDDELQEYTPSGHPQTKA